MTTGARAEAGSARPARPGADDSPEVEVLRTWASPGPGDDPRDTRPKLYGIVRLQGGVTAFRKSDSALEYVTHEAAILRALAGVPGVPVLVGETSAALYTEFLDARPLQDAVAESGVLTSLRVGWQVLTVVSRIHARGVVHADIRPWNFLVLPGGRVYLIDFEYAYLPAQPDVPALLRVHHYDGLKTPLTDWLDAWHTLAGLWAASRSRVVRSGLSSAALGVYWGLRLWRIPQHLWERGSRFRS